jgi:hypothetical protein
MGWNFPAGHDRQDDADVAPREAEYLPATQLWHSSLPLSALYFPAEQLTHALFRRV